MDTETQQQKTNVTYFAPAVVSPVDGPTVGSTWRLLSLVWPLLLLLLLLPNTTSPSTRCSTVQYTRHTAPPLSLRSHRKRGGNNRSPTPLNCPKRAPKGDSKQAFFVFFPPLRTIVPKNTKDRIFVTDALPNMVIRGVAFVRSGTYVIRTAGPPGTFPGSWLAGETSSWKTWPRLNVWRVEDIVFAVQAGGVQYRHVECCRGSQWREVSSVMFWCVT